MLLLIKLEIELPGRGPLWLLPRLLRDRYAELNQLALVHVFAHVLVVRLLDALASDELCALNQDARKLSVLRE